MVERGRATLAGLGAVGLFQPMIAVRDVAASSRGYQELLGCASGHGGAEYERLVKAVSDAIHHNEHIPRITKSRIDPSCL